MADKYFTNVLQQKSVSETSETILPADTEKHPRRLKSSAPPL
jgi:hypothetical protein